MIGRLRFDAIAALSNSDHPALRYFARRDLLGERVGSVSSLWNAAEAVRIVARQEPDGRWRYPGGDPGIRTRDNYDQLETYRHLAVLVHKFGFTHRHPAVERAAQFLACFQSGVGDYRGIYGAQYTPNYSAAITELLIRAGYGHTAQVSATMRWLAAIRQDDGGWAIPTRTRGLPLQTMLATAETVEPDRTQPSSHLVTGIVLRAFAAHPTRRRSAMTHRAGELLKSRFFTRDRYPDRAAASYWTIFSYPFWWTDLLSALDALTLVGFAASDPTIAQALTWFIDHQQSDGLWNTGHNRPKGRYSDQWVALAAYRMLTRSQTDRPPLRPTGPDHEPPSRTTSVERQVG